MADTPFLYDVITYPGEVRPQMHPMHLAAIARLHDIPAAPPSRCRFLEVGCGDAASLLPLAMAYPEAQFFGIDLSREAIAHGESYRSRLGLRNLSLELADLTKWQPPGEPFDYVVAHGFYSWVPAVARDALLALCRDRLAPHGVAYISYNALPGCHLRRVLWDTLRFHVREIEEPRERLQQAKALLNFLIAGATGKQADLLKDEAAGLLDRSTHPSALFHDDLANVNDPVSITEFLRHAARFGLQFLAEADYFSMSTEQFPEQVAAVLSGMEDTDVVLKEQYLDYLKLRRFRQTLLCRGGLPRAGSPNPGVLAGLSITSRAEASGQVDLAPGVAVQFKANNGAAGSFSHPVVKAAFMLLKEAYPFPLTFADLESEAHRRVDSVGPGGDAKFDAFFRHACIECFRAGLIDLLAEPPGFARTAGPRPQASPLARLQLAEGRETVTSLKPSVVALETALARELVALLDGTRDRERLLDDLAARVAAHPDSRPAGNEPRPASWWQEQLAPQIESGLAGAARNALLVA